MSLAMSLIIAPSEDIENPSDEKEKPSISPFSSSFENSVILGVSVFSGFCNKDVSRGLDLQNFEETKLQ